VIRAIVLAWIIGPFAGSVASAQPPQFATELVQIVGTWQGTLTTRGQHYPITLTIQANGSWESVVPGIGTGHFSGTVRVVDGEFRYHTNENGIDGTYTLREGDGTRVLELLNDPHTTSASMAPKR